MRLVVGLIILGLALPASGQSVVMAGGGETLATAMVVTVSARADGKVGGDASGPGPLRILFGDGTRIAIAPEIWPASPVAPVSPQAAFEMIKVSPDRRTVGWLADFSVCAQSYPCPVELGLYRAGAPIRRILPDHGIFWGWGFIRAGRAVVAQSGYAHGPDDGVYDLYDAGTGRLLARYGAAGPAPAWVGDYNETNH